VKKREVGRRDENGEKKGEASVGGGENNVEGWEVFCRARMGIRNDRGTYQKPIKYSKRKREFWKKGRVLAMEVTYPVVEGQ